MWFTCTSFSTTDTGEIQTSHPPYMHAYAPIPTPTPTPTHIHIEMYIQTYIATPLEHSGIECILQKSLITILALGTSLKDLHIVLEIELFLVASLKHENLVTLWDWTVVWVHRYSGVIPRNWSGPHSQVYMAWGYNAVCTDCGERTGKKMYVEFRWLCKCV